MNKLIKSPTSVCYVRAHPQFTVRTHIEYNKFLLVNIFQNIILYTNIYLDSVPSVESFTCVYIKKKKKSKALR